MNRIEIKADGPCEVLLNGSPMLSVSGTNLEPDHITITLTEREAELVRHLTAKVGGSPHHSFRGQAGAISSALGSAGFYLLDYGNPRRALEGDVMAMAGCATGYAHAERLGGVHGDIRLTMDRDVAVTLKSLLYRLEWMGELEPVKVKLDEAGVYAFDEPRFTGVIKWKKRRLTMCECEVGKTYKKVGTQEWEEA